MKQKKIDLRRTCRFKRFVRRAYAAFNSMHKVVNIGVVAGCVLAFVPAAPAAGQSQPVAVRDVGPDQELDEVLVTSSRAELTLNQTAKLVTIITRDEIERQPAQSISDLLKTIVGIDVRQRGANGVLSDVSIRGGTFDQIAILLNGVNLSNPHTGHYSFDLPVNLSDIERIEIIQGPASLLYGAGAFSGGINIVTKKDSETGVYLNAEGGMYGLRGAETRASLKTESSSHSFSAGYNASDGYIADSDYKLFNAFWQSRFHVDNSKLDLQLGYNDKAYGANTFYSPAYPNQYDDTQSLFASVSGESGTALKFIPRLYWNRHYDCFQLFRDGTPDIPSWYTSHNYHYSDVFGVNLNARYQWAGGVTNFGGEIRNEGIYSNKLGKDTVNLGKYTVRDNRTNIDYFFEHTYLYKGFTLGIGVLANYNTAFSNKIEFYPSINAAYRLTKNLKILASWNNAVRMPTFTDLYYVDPAQKGFPDLQPEKSEAFDIGLKYSNFFFSGSVNGFYEKGKNLIDWVRTSEEEQLRATNLTSVDKTGFEANASLFFKELLPQLSATRLDMGYMYLYQTKDARNLISNYVLDYLRHKFTVGLSHPIYKGLSADWQFRRQQRDGSYSKYLGKDAGGKNRFEEEPYPAFSLLDVKISWKIKAFTVYATANNLFNASYYDRGNLPQPGFWLLGGVSWRL